MGARPFAVRTRAELARVARLTNNNDGDGRARVLMEEAVALAESLGTTGIAAEVLSR